MGDMANGDGLDFDPDALRERYRRERDKRLRADGVDQYREGRDELARFVDVDPLVPSEVDRDPVDEDVEVNPTGVFVAQEFDKVLGYISTRLDYAAGKGRIPNLAVDKSVRGRGIGRFLIEHALDYFRREGMSFAMIETMDNNQVGQHLYPSCGFVEACRQIHFAKKL
jgi:ribosomal protein S18 acetylase RimI-like enzyme